MKSFVCSFYSDIDTVDGITRNAAVYLCDRRVIPHKILIWEEEEEDSAEEEVVHHHHHQDRHKHLSDLCNNQFSNQYVLVEE